MTTERNVLNYKYRINVIGIMLIDIFIEKPMFSLSGCNFIF